MNRVVIMTNFKTQSAKDYYNYLNEIGDGKKNIVIDTVVALINSNFSEEEEIKIADIGCFNGVMLNVIYEKLSLKLKEKVTLIGFDSDYETLDIGRVKFPYIQFHYYELNKRPPINEKYHLIIISNVFHELFSNCLPNKEKAIKELETAFKQIANLVKVDGYLVLMDGLSPDKKDNLVTVDFKNLDILNKFVYFADSSHYFLPIKYTKLSGTRIDTSLKDLAIFLTKYRYMDKTYWDMESKQIYQYYSKKEFYELFQSSEFRIIAYESQPLSNINDIIEILDKKVSAPNKNVLIIGQKLNT